MTIQSGTLKLDIRTISVGPNDFGGPEYHPDFQALMQLSAGVSAYQFDREYFDERTVAASTADDIDLAGVLKDEFGTTLTFVNIVAIAVFNQPRSGVPNVSSLSVGGAASNAYFGFMGGASQKVNSIGPGGIFLIGSPGAAGLGVVTAATADILTVTNGAGGSATYQIAILGRSA